MTAYEELLKRAYELYKADWCAVRGYDPALVQKAEMEDMQYNGEMYASIGEFEDCEFKDEEYMRKLLGTDYNSDMSKVAAEGKDPLLIGHSLAGRTRLRNIYEVANFICTHGQYGDLHITHKDGTPFLDTFGIYINKITDMICREELLKVLIPMQKEIDGTNKIDKTEERNMNKFEAERRFIQRMKDNYPPGTRIMLLQMGDDPRPVEPNTRGTVEVVDDMGTPHCIFDNGRQLGIVPGEDSFRKLTSEELAEEQTMAEPEDFSMKMQ